MITKRAECVILVATMILSGETAIAFGGFFLAGAWMIFGNNFYNE